MQTLEGKQFYPDCGHDDSKLDDYYNKDTDKKGIAEIIIAKQRNGPIGTIELAWLSDYTKFGNLDRRRGE